MARPRTVQPRSLRHASLGQAIELIVAENVDLDPTTVMLDSGLDEKQIGTYVRGQGNPTYTTLLKLCDGLHVSVATLMARAESLHEDASDITPTGRLHDGQSEHHDGAAM